ncbi:MAG: DoxX family protein [Acidobacteria bacterium]|nr:DoxX family protein [Acidobacteriota bacterium]MCA1649150.1 DoxX family protein [Acidobacteriota bacterium]
MQPYGLAILRLAIGAIFIAHGAQKLFPIWGGVDGTAAFFTQLGLAPAVPLAVLVAVVEFFGGIMLVLGAQTMVVALALAIDMVVAIWKVHFANGFFINWTMAPGQGHGYEFNLTLLGALVALMLTGPGALSVDGQRARTAESRAAGRARLRAGKV